MFFNVEINPVRFFIQQQDTHISLKIKLKRQKSGTLWEIVSVQEESTVDGSKVCESSDAPPVMHSLVEVTTFYNMDQIK